MQNNRNREKKIEYLKGLITGKVIIRKPEEPTKNMVEIWDLDPNDRTMVIEQHSKRTMTVKEFDSWKRPMGVGNTVYTMIISPWIKNGILKSERHQLSEL